MKKYNAAQQILIAIGGTAALVGGYDDHYYADFQTQKRQRKRPIFNDFGGRLRGQFGRALMASFDMDRLVAKKIKNAQ